MRAKLSFLRAIETHGHLHPSAWSAWGRFVAVWGIRRAARIPLLNPPPALLELAAVAYARATSSPGDSNRRARRAHHRNQGAFS